jgi:hypothetical protein
MTGSWIAFALMLAAVALVGAELVLITDRRRAATVLVTANVAVWMFCGGVAVLIATISSGP